MTMFEFGWYERKPAVFRAGTTVHNPDGTMTIGVNWPVASIVVDAVANGEEVARGIVASMNADPAWTGRPADLLTTDRLPRGPHGDECACVDCGVSA